MRDDYEKEVLLRCYELALNFRQKGRCHFHPDDLAEKFKYHYGHDLPFEKFGFEDAGQFLESSSAFFRMTQHEWDRRLRVYLSEDYRWQYKLPPDPLIVTTIYLDTRPPEPSVVKPPAEENPAEERCAAEASAVDPPIKEEPVDHDEPSPQPIKPEPVDDYEQGQPRVAAPLERVAAPQERVAVAQPVATRVVPVAQPAVVVARPVAPVAVPVATPVVAVAKPVAAVAQPVTPVIRPPVPVAHPVASVARHVVPVTKPAAPVAQSAVAMARPVVPIAPVAVPVAPPVVPVARPIPPVVRPPVPVAHPVPAAVASVAAPVAPFSSAILHKAPSPQSPEEMQQEELHPPDFTDERDLGHFPCTSYQMPVSCPKEAVKSTANVGYKPPVMVCIRESDTKLCSENLVDRVTRCLQILDEDDKKRSVDGFYHLSNLVNLFEERYNQSFVQEFRNAFPGHPSFSHLETISNGKICLKKNCRNWFFGLEDSKRAEIVPKNIAPKQTVTVEPAMEFGRDWAENREILVNRVIACFTGEQEDINLAFIQTHYRKRYGTEFILDCRMIFHLPKGAKWTTRFQEAAGGKIKMALYGHDWHFELVRRDRPTAPAITPAAASLPSSSNQPPSIGNHITNRPDFNRPLPPAAAASRLPATNTPSGIPSLAPPASQLSASQSPGILRSLPQGTLPSGAVPVALPAATVASPVVPGASAVLPVAESPHSPEEMPQDELPPASLEPEEEAIDDLVPVPCASGQPPVSCPKDGGPKEDRKTAYKPPVMVCIRDSDTKLCRENLVDRVTRCLQILDGDGERRSVDGFYNLPTLIHIYNERYHHAFTQEFRNSFDGHHPFSHLETVSNGKICVKRGYGNWFFGLEDFTRAKIVPKNIAPKQTVTVEPAMEFGRDWGENREILVNRVIACLAGEQEEVYVKFLCGKYKRLYGTGFVPDCRQILNTPKGGIWATRLEEAAEGKIQMTRIGHDLCFKLFGRDPSAAPAITPAAANLPSSSNQPPSFTNVASRSNIPLPPAAASRLSDTNTPSGIPSFLGLPLGFPANQLSAILPPSPPDLMVSTSRLEMPERLRQCLLKTETYRCDQQTLNTIYEDTFGEDLNVHLIRAFGTSAPESLQFVLGEMIYLLRVNCKWIYGIGAAFHPSPSTRRSTSGAPSRDDRAETSHKRSHSPSVDRMTSPKRSRQ